MPDFLSAAAVDALTGPAIDADRIERKAEIFVEGDPATNRDVSSLVTDWGSLRLEAWNISPGDRGSASFPALELVAVNTDATFAEFNAAGVWQGRRPQEFRLRITLSLRFDDGSTETLLDATFGITDAWIDGPLARITASSLLARHWAHTIDELTESRDFLPPSPWL